MNYNPADVLKYVSRFSFQKLPLRARVMYALIIKLIERAQNCQRHKSDNDTCRIATALQSSPTVPAEYTNIKYQYHMYYSRQVTAKIQFFFYYYSRSSARMKAHNVCYKCSRETREQKSSSLPAGHTQWCVF